MSAYLAIQSTIERGHVAATRLLFINALLSGDGAAARALPMSMLRAIRSAINLSGKRSSTALPPRGWSSWQRTYWAWFNSIPIAQDTVGDLNDLVPETEADYVIACDIDAVDHKTAILELPLRKLAANAIANDVLSQRFLIELVSSLRDEVPAATYDGWMRILVELRMDEIVRRLGDQR